MLSEGRTTVDTVFALRNGTLTMYLDKEAYERAGLVGKPYGVKGRRCGKPRWGKREDEETNRPHWTWEQSLTSV